MEVSEVKQRLLTDFFTYYPMGGALYETIALSGDWD